MDIQSTRLLIDVFKVENGYVLLHIDKRIVIARDRWDFRKAIEDAASALFDKLEGEVSDGADD